MALAAGEDVEEERALERSVRAILLHQVSTTGISLTLIQPRQQLLAKTLSESQLTNQVNAAASLIGALEFLLAPTIGVLSDRVGRRMLMLSAPIIGVVLRFLAVVRPAAPVLMLERIVGDLTRALLGTTMCHSALADSFQGSALTGALARCSSAMGAGMILAPLIGQVSAKLGGARGAFSLCTLLTLTQLVTEWKILHLPRLVDEPACATGAAAGSSDGNGAAAAVVAAPPLVSPFNFVRLFTSCGPRVRAIACLLACQCAIDGKLLQDQLSIIQMYSCGWTLSQRSMWSSAFGASIMVGGQLTSRLVRLLGDEQRFMSLAHFSSVAAFLAYSRGAFWAGLIPMIVGQQRRVPTVSWLVADARLHGLGRGEVIAMTANLRAAVETVGPIVYNLGQRLATRLGNPARVFYAAAFVGLLAEAVRAFTRVSECGPQRDAARKARTEALASGPPGKAPSAA
mmetsp:Transcript_97089/g.271760  ORF Transcript_97089/g.271760 Transcript_97089/m.271760 type:complete len:457 (-) Transcript_97089:52-1422(-)